MIEKLFPLFDKTIRGYGFGDVTVKGGGKGSQRVVEDYHPTAHGPVGIEIDPETEVTFDIPLHNGYQAKGTATVKKSGEPSNDVKFDLKKGEKIEISSGVVVEHHYRK